jgi:hypothetical protein
MTDYLREHTDADGNPLAFTEDNLELAFAATEPQLVPFQAPVVEETVQPVTNTPAVSTVQHTPTVPTPEIKPAEATEATLATPVATVTPPNPQVPEQMRKEQKNPARKAEIARVIAAHNKQRASRV